MTSYEMQKKISEKPAYAESPKKFKNLAERREAFETSRKDVKPEEKKEAKNG